jgi:hypothetical protein
MALIATGVKQHPSEYIYVCNWLYFSAYSQYNVLAKNCVNNFCLLLKVVIVTCVFCHCSALSEAEKATLRQSLATISVSPSIKLQHSWLWLYQKLPGIAPHFIWYLVQQSTCTFASHRFQVHCYFILWLPIWISRFRAYWILILILYLLFLLIIINILLVWPLTSWPINFSTYDPTK